MVEIGPDHFVAAMEGEDKIGMVVQKVLDGLLKVGPFEEIGFFFSMDEGISFGGQFLSVGAIDNLTIEDKGLFFDIIPAFIGAEGDMSVIFDGFPEGVDGGVMLGVGGADKSVEGNVETIPEILEGRGDGIGVGFGVEVIFLGGFQHFLAMFIGSGLEVDIVAEQALGSGNDVGTDEFEGVSKVGSGIGIGNGGGDGVTTHVGRPRETDEMITKELPCGG